MAKKQPRRYARDPYKNYDSWDDRADAFEARPLWTIFKWGIGVIVVVCALVAIAGLVSVGNVFWQGERAELTNPAREKAIVFDPNRTLNTYEGFYDSCNLYNATVQNANDAQESAERRESSYDANADTFGTQRKSIDAQFENARAIRSQARNIAAEYNADSSANTRAPFKAAELPYNLPTDGGTTVECGTAKEGGR